MSLLNVWVTPSEAIVAVDTDGVRDKSGKALLQLAGWTGALMPGFFNFTGEPHEIQTR